MPTNVQQRGAKSVPTVSSNGLGVVAVLLVIVVAIAILASFVDLTATELPLSDVMLWAP
jgi:hypothetical protein